MSVVCPYKECGDQSVYYRIRDLEGAVERLEKDKRYIMEVLICLLNPLTSGGLAVSKRLQGKIAEGEKLDH